MTQMLRALLLSFFVMAWQGAAVAAGPWPTLPSAGFMKGRAASRADVRAGDAAFSLGDAREATPIAIELPQYAYFLDGGKREPVIVIQAEEIRGKGMKLFGARKRDGSTVVGFATDFILVGTKSPFISKGGSK